MPTATMMPIHPNQDATVLEKRRVMLDARAALAAIEQHARDLERATESTDELTRLHAAHELTTMRERYLAAKTAAVQAEHDYDQAQAAASRPWQTYWHAQYRQAAETFLQWLETDALPANEQMLKMQEACNEAGVRVDALHVPQLLPDAITHRTTVGRKGLGL